MLRIVNLEEIQGLLLRVPELVNKLDGYDLDYLLGVKNWLQDAEKALSKNRLPAAGSVASLRAVLNSVEDGGLPPGYSFQKRLSHRKVIKTVASDFLRQSSDMITQTIQADTSRLNEANQLTRQLVALANYKSLIPDPSKITDWTGYIKAVWRAITADKDLQPGAVRLLGLVGPTDALLLLDRTITADLLSAPEFINRQTQPTASTHGNQSPSPPPKPPRKQKKTSTDPQEKKQ